MAQWKKALSLALALVMMLGMIPFNMNAKADGETFTVIWKDDAGAELAKSNVPKDTSPVYPKAELPSKDAGNPAQTCRFTGWRDDSGVKYYSSFPKAERDVTYTAEFDTTIRKCVVIFVDSDGTELLRGTYDYGTSGSAVTQPSTPSKASDARFDYTFDGWELDADGVNGVRTVTGDAVYKAHYTATPRSCTVTWLDANGATLEVDTGVTVDDMPSYNGAAPAKASDATYSYAFAGWTPAVTPVVGDTTYTAYYSQTRLVPNGEETHTVLWVDAKGEPITSNTVKHGDTPTAPAETPTKEADERYTYAFAGWTPAIAPATGDVVYTATFDATERLYTLNRENGSVTLETKHGVTYDNIPDYVGITPIREDTKENSYLFSGWKTNVDKLHGVITMQAQFVAVKKEYPVAFLNENGQVLQVEMTPYDETPAAPAAPAKAKNEEFEYSFAGWTPELAPVTGGAAYTASYKAEKRYYVVTFVNWDNTQLGDAASYLYGTKVDDMTQPTAARPDAGGYTYAFVGWTRSAFDANAGTITYKAEYSASAAFYNVTWKDWDGSVLETDENLPYSATALPTYDGAEPSRASTTEHTYTFAGWTPAVTPVVSDATYTADYAEAPRIYTIKWMNGDTLLDTTEVAYGETPVYTKAAPTKESDKQTIYTFDQWLPAITAVEGDATYVASFKESPRLYEITYHYEAFNEAKDAVVENGNMPTSKADVGYYGDSSYPGAKDTEGKPYKAPSAQYTYVFDSWNKDFDVVTDKATYTARFTALLNKYTVTWVDGDGSVLETDYNVPYGTTPTYDSVDPTKNADAKAKYVWKDGNDGWKADNETDAGIVPVKGDTTYTAQFTPHYKITWLDGDGSPLKTDYVPEGVTPSYTGPAPAKAHPDPDKRWKWDQTDPWTPDVVPATDAATYSPNFVEGPKEYSINWNYPDPTDGSDQNVPTNVPWNEDVVKPDGVPYFPKWVNVNDPTDVYDPTQPAKKPDADKTYVPLFTITWDNPTDPDYIEEDVPYGKPVNKPDDSKLEDTVENNPWAEKDDPNNTHFTPHNATKNETFKPLYNITWKPENGSPDRTDEVKLGDTPKYGTNPTKSGYTFSKWDPTPYPANKDQTYTAKYNPVSTGGGSSGGGSATPAKPATVPITWVVDGKQTVTDVPKGDTPVYPNGTPTKDGATFVRWTPEIVPADQPATYTAVFTDSPNYRARPDVTGVDKKLETGEHIIYYRGYPDGTIKPYGNITRHETAMILYRLLLDKDVPITKTFSDVPEESWYTTAVLTLASLGIITGNPDGTFRPADAITRAEFTTMCVRFVKAQEAHFEFTDVSKDSWAYKAIMTAAYYGWINGYPDGTFRPNAYIARCEAAAVVNRMLGRAADKDYVTKHESELIYFPDLLHEWYYYEMVEGTNAHDYDVVNDVETWKTMYDK